MSRTHASLLLAALAACPALAQDVAALGKQRAEAAKIRWETRDGLHPTMGSIRFAYPKEVIFTPVGISRVSSRVWVSCEAGSGKMAVELANASAPDDPGGLLPKSVPRLVCNKPAGRDRKPVQEDLPARWSINEIGDALVRGLQPAALRQCVSITVLQEVMLPKGWAKPSAPVEFEIATYASELDTIFSACGETSIYASAPPEPVVTPPPPPPKKNGEAPWISAQTIAGGRSNVRARPSTDAPVVAQLPPGARVLVQNAGSSWWRVKPTAGGKLDGYMREDRLQFK